MHTRLGAVLLVTAFLSSLLATAAPIPAKQSDQRRKQVSESAGVAHARGAANTSLPTDTTAYNNPSKKQVTPAVANSDNGSDQAQRRDWIDRVSTQDAHPAPPKAKR